MSVLTPRGTRLGTALAVQIVVGLAVGVGAWFTYAAAIADTKPAFKPTDMIALLIPTADTKTRSMLTLSSATIDNPDLSTGFAFGTGVTLDRSASSADRTVWLIAEGKEAIRAIRSCQEDLGVREAKPPDAVEHLWQWGGSRNGAYLENELRAATYFEMEATTGSAIEERVCLLPTSSGIAKSATGLVMQTPQLVTVWGGDWTGQSSGSPFGCVELAIPSVAPGSRRDYVSPDGFTEEARTSTGSPDYLQMCSDPSISTVGARTVLPAVTARYFQFDAESSLTSWVFVAGALFSLGLGLLFDAGNRVLSEWIEQAKSAGPSNIGPAVDPGYSDESGNVVNEPDYSI